MTNTNLENTIEISGKLSEYSLGELFQFIQEGKKTGILTIQEINDKNTSKIVYIWCSQGKIVAASNNLKATGLRSLIEQRQWLTAMDIDEAIEMCKSKKLPLGPYLRSLGLLDVDQLKLLFYIQVMQQICALFQLKDAKYQLTSDSNLPLLEMTGLSASMTEVILAGLRALKDWSALEDKMPDQTSGLIPMINGEPPLNLNETEKEVWRYTNGTVSLQQIASKLSLSLSEVKKIGFRLIMVSLAEEIPFVNMGEKKTMSADEEDLNDVILKNSGLSGPFLENLAKFLKAKARA
ncbi:MAG TPA: DUF4388 domain-containing protein [Allocoleopsis sp.]